MCHWPTVAMAVYLSGVLSLFLENKEECDWHMVPHIIVWPLWLAFAAIAAPIALFLDWWCCSGPWDPSRKPLPLPPPTTKEG